MDWFNKKENVRGKSVNLSSISDLNQSHYTPSHRSHADTPSERHRAGYGIIYLNASVHVRVHQHHVWKCFVTLPLTDQVYLAADCCAAREELFVQTFLLLQHSPLIRLHVKTQSLAPKQVEGAIEICGNQVVSVT